MSTSLIVRKRWGTISFTVDTGIIVMDIADIVLILSITITIVHIITAITVDREDKP